MKKLLLAAGAAVALVGAAGAASSFDLNWLISGMTDRKGNPYSGTATVYINNEVSTSCTIQNGSGSATDYWFSYTFSSGGNQSVGTAYFTCEADDGSTFRSADVSIMVTPIDNSSAWDEWTQNMEMAQQGMDDDMMAYLYENQPETYLGQDTDVSFNGAGTWTVPEPTSGLLMLIGMAGLALKRKRA